MVVNEHLIPVEVMHMINYFLDQEEGSNIMEDNEWRVPVEWKNAINYYLDLCYETTEHNPEVLCPQQKAIADYIFDHYGGGGGSIIRHPTISISASSPSGNTFEIGSAITIVAKSAIDKGYGMFDISDTKWTPGSAEGESTTYTGIATNISINASINYSGASIGTATSNTLTYSFIPKWAYGCSESGPFSASEEGTPPTLLQLTSILRGQYLGTTTLASKLETKSTKSTPVTFPLDIAEDNGYKMVFLFPAGWNLTPYENGFACGDSYTKSTVIINNGLIDVSYDTYVSKGAYYEKGLSFNIEWRV